MLERLTGAFSALREVRLQREGPPIRWTVDSVTLDAFVVPRVLPCAASFGFDPSVRHDLFDPFVSENLRAAPNLGLVVVAIQALAYKSIAPLTTGLGVVAKKI